MQMEKRDTKKLKKELEDYKRLAQCAREFHMVGDATRLKICYLLCCHKELSVGEIADVVGVSISAVSHTLKKLHQADIVIKRREFRTVYYQLKDSSFVNLLKRRIQNHETINQ